MDISSKYIKKNQISELSCWIAMSGRFRVEETARVYLHHSAARAWALLKTSVLCVREKRGSQQKAIFSVR